MDFFSVLSLIGGLALFLFGMNTMGDGLEKLSGGRLEKMLEKMTSSTFKGFLLGLGVTAIIQSSSATTVMVVGFVNSGIMQLGQAVGIIMGANVGTTVTAWLLSLTGVQGDSFFMQMLKPINFSPILAIIGIALTMFAKNSKKKDAGSILIGFAVLMFGMNTMSSAVEPLAEIPEFTSILTMFSNPLFGILAGAALTAVIQSSSASVGILQALSLTGSISFATAIPIVMGQNIGTCVTAILSCIGAKKNAKRAAFVHLYFNIIGTVILLALFYGINAFVNFDFLNDMVNPADIAIIHTAFNVLTTALMLPFAKLLEKLACLTVRDKDEKDGEPFIDERFLATPAIATAQCKTMTIKMAELSKQTILDSFKLIGNYHEKAAQIIMDNEDKLDKYEDILGTYLVKLCSKSLTSKDSAEVSKMLHDIGDFERIGDHAVNVLGVAKEMSEKKVVFSKSACEELKVLNTAITENLDNSIEAFENNDFVLAERVEPLEQVIDNLTDELKMRHVKRLQDGECTIELGFMFSDLITNYERVSDHCSNIAVCLIELGHESFGTHEYMHEIKDLQQSEFVEAYKEYKIKYVLPETVQQLPVPEPV